MNPRATRSLKLLLLLLLLTFISFQPASKATADTINACNMTCWQDTCQANYFDCIDSGGTPSGCCRNANQCAAFCGSGCPLFC